MPNAPQLAKLIAILAIALPDWAPADEWRLDPQSERMALIAGNLTLANISGFALMGKESGILADDQGSVVHVATLSGQTVTLGREIRLPKVKRGDEIDIEGVAADPSASAYFVTASHAVSRSKSKVKRDRYRIFRIPADPDTGLPSANARVTHSSLSAVIKADPVLARYFEKPLQRSGINIEGLAAKDGKLFFGLRSPSSDGNAFVIEVDSKKLFGDGTPTHKLHKLKLGRGLGIRAFTTVPGGFVLIAGNAGSQPSEKFVRSESYQNERGYSLFFWDSTTGGLQRIGALPHSRGRAESIALAGHRDNRLDLIIFRDGPQNGSPALFTLRK